MRRPALAFVLLLGLSAPAAALVGGATEVRDSGAGRHIVMIISTRGNFCTATALARDLVLTAGHCVAPAATYRVLIDQPPASRSAASSCIRATTRRTTPAAESPPMSR